MRSFLPHLVAQALAVARSQALRSRRVAVQAHSPAPHPHSQALRLAAQALRAFLQVLRHLAALHPVAVQALRSPAHPAHSLVLRVRALKHCRAFTSCQIAIFQVRWLLLVVVQVVGVASTMGSWAVLQMIPMECLVLRTIIGAVHLPIQVSREPVWKSKSM